MIVGNIENIVEYSFLEEKVKECFGYMKKNDLKLYQPGKYQIDGDDFFVNIVEYETTEKENRFYEAHRYYIDIHVMLDGEEKIEVDFIKNMDQKEFEPENDFLPLFEKNQNLSSSIILKENDFAIFYPNDAHMTAIKVNDSKKIKKAIFKVKI